MPLWTLDKPPAFKNPGGKELVRTERGWEDPDTGEVLVAISNLATKGGASLITSVSFGSSSYLGNDPLSVIVHFVEKVDVVAGATIEISWSGQSGNITLHAAAQSNTYNVVFDKQSDNTTPEVVPSDLAIAAEGILTLSGNASDGETVTIDGKVYTFEAVLTDVDGNVLIGVDASESIDNLIAAINLDAGAGSLYAASTTAHESVSAAAGAGDTLELTALVAGADGNDIATLTDLAAGSFGAATLEGGVDGGGTLSVASQTISGTITDDLGAAPAELLISAAAASSAGIRVVA